MQIESVNKYFWPLICLILFTINYHNKKYVLDFLLILNALYGLHPVYTATCKLA